LNELNTVIFEYNRKMIGRNPLLSKNAVKLAVHSFRSAYSRKE